MASLNSMATTVSLLATVLLFLASAPGGTTAYSAGQIIFTPGDEKQVTKEPPSCSEVIEEGQYVVNPDCSPQFYKYCYKDRIGGGDNVWANSSYSPNCLGQVTLEDMKNQAFGEGLAAIIDHYRNMTEPRVVRCMDMLIPFLCSTAFPLTFGAGIRLAPCIGYCHDVYKICTDAGLPMHQYNLSCVSMFGSIPGAHCPPNTKPNLPKCIPSPVLDPPACFKECPSPDSNPIANCTKKERKCQNPNKAKQVRQFIAGKNYSKFKFGAHVKVLEEVHLCQPINSIAYKVKIINDHFLDCAVCDKYSRKFTSGSVIYVLSTDSITDCSKRCVEPKVIVEEEYFMMGTIHTESHKHQGKCGVKIWVLDSLKTAGSVLYPWKDVKRKKELYSRHTLKKFECKAPCERNSDEKMIVRPVLGA